MQAQEEKRRAEQQRLAARLVKQIYIGCQAVVCIFVFKTYQMFSNLVVVEAFKFGFELLLIIVGHSCNMKGGVSPTI